MEGGYQGVDEVDPARETRKELHFENWKRKDTEEGSNVWQ